MHFSRGTLYKRGNFINAAEEFAYPIDYENAIRPCIGGERKLFEESVE